MNALIPDQDLPGESGTLRIVRSGDTPTDHLAVAVRHIEAAIIHINNGAQARVPTSTAGTTNDVEQLRLIVRALADIREALREPGTEDASSTPESR